MLKAIYLLVLLSFTVTNANCQAKGDIQDRKLSYQELLDEMANCTDSVYSLSNALIVFDNAKDQRFLMGEDSLLSANLDTVYINTPIVLKEVHFEKRDDTFQPDFLKIRFQKSISLYNCEVEAQLPFVNCVFDNDITIEDEPGSNYTYTLLFSQCILNGISNFHIYSNRIDFQETIFNAKVQFQNNHPSRGPLSERCFIYFKTCSFHDFITASFTKTWLEFSNCTFNPINVKGNGRYILGTSDASSYLTFSHCLFDTTSKNYSLTPNGTFYSLRFYNNKFNIPLNIQESTIEDLTMHNNKFNALVNMTNVNFQSYKSELFYDDLGGALSVYSNRQTELYRPTSYHHFSDTIAAERLFSMFRRLTDHFKHRGNRKDYNQMFVEMKDLETMQLEYYYHQNPSTSNFFTLKMNRFLKEFSAYGTDPVIAIIYSIKVILIFAVFYFFFHNDWDYSNNQKIGNRLRFILRYFKIDKGLIEIEEAGKSYKNEAYLELLKESKTNKNQVPKFFYSFTNWYLTSNRGSESIRNIVLNRIDILKGTWAELDRAKQIRISFLSSLWFVLYLSYSILSKILNAITLSLNTFTTLGFGNIPTKGFSRYVVVLEGFIGWVLMTVFSVTLITQLLK